MKGLKSTMKLPRIQRKDLDSSSSQQEEQSKNQQPIHSSHPNTDSELISLQNQLLHDSQVGYDTGNYVMQQIRSRRWNIHKKMFQYLIKWKGYSVKECTWQTTEDIIREPCLKIKDLGKNAMLPIFERSHACTKIWDENKNTNVKDYYHTWKNHQKYASKQLIDEMEAQFKKYYGSSQDKSNNSINLESSINEQKVDSNISKNQFQCNDQQPTKKLFQSEDIEIRSLIIEKVTWQPYNFDLKICIRLKSHPNLRKVLTCEQLMRIYPDIGIIFYKIKLNFIIKFKTEIMKMNETIDKKRNKQILI